MSAGANYVRAIVESMSHASLEDGLFMSGESLWTKGHYGSNIVTIQAHSEGRFREVCPVDRYGHQVRSGGQDGPSMSG